MSHVHDFKENNNGHWAEAQAEELSFWMTPGAELGEQIKQITYVRYLGLDFIHDGNSPYVIQKTGLNIVDVGGGPVSLLLKTLSDRKIVVDPCKYPNWVDSRYSDNGVEWLQIEGEYFIKDVINLGLENKVDEVWMYNVLQHVENPQKIFRNIYRSLKKGGVFRFVDWIDTPTNTAHPISLSRQITYEYIKDAGFMVEFDDVKTDVINENGAVGKIAYGVFTK